MRHGKVVGHCDPRKETAASLARMMVGNEVQAVVRAPIEGIEKAAPLLEIRSLSRKPATPDGPHRSRRRRRRRGGRGRGRGGGGGGGASEPVPAPA